MGFNNVINAHDVSDLQRHYNMAIGNGMECYIKEFKYRYGLVVNGNMYTGEKDCWRVYIYFNNKDNPSVHMGTYQIMLSCCEEVVSNGKRYLKIPSGKYYYLKNKIRLEDDIVMLG